MFRRSAAALVTVVATSVVSAQPVRRVTPERQTTHDLKRLSLDELAEIDVTTWRF